MFVYLSKKIAIPNNVQLRSIGWNNDQGWIACGGDDGLLKVLKLEANTSATGSNTQLQQDPKAAGSNLSMNQTLEGHSGPVLVTTWNQQHRKLTTSDGNGLIIVWVLYQGVWYEEMINNRNKSLVTDMSWNKDGTQICIIYEDGAVIVGSVDGNRIWGKEFRNTTLAFVQWSPDSKYILFGTSQGELNLYDANGSFMNKLDLRCNDGAAIKLSGLDWYNGVNGYTEPHAPCLAVGFENGKIQISKSERDIHPIIIDTKMRYMKLKWNPNGSLLAVSGLQVAKTSQGEEKEVCVVQFYDPFGQHIRSLKIPGKRITSLTWEYTGLRVALAVDSFIYFANVRPDYKWCHFAKDVLVYAYTKPDRLEQCLCYWNTKTNERVMKYPMKLYLLTSTGDVCLMATKPEEQGGQYLLTITNAIGVAIETKYIDFEPTFGMITKSHVFVANGDLVLFWQYRNTVGSTRATALDALRKKTDIKDRAFHIDDISVIGTQAGENNATALELRSKGPSTDPIVCITASETTFIIGRASGTLLHFLVPSMTLENRYETPVRMQSLALNSSSTKLLILDIGGVLRMFELEKKVSGVFGGLVSAAAKLNETKDRGGKLLEFERKEVWDMRWSDDNPDLFAAMEKTKLYIFRGTDPEEPMTSNGYISGFSDLSVSTVQLDEVIQEPDSPPKDCFIQIETKTLRDTRSILQHSSLADAIQFVENKSHPRLWKIIGDFALENLDFPVAQKAYVRCSDYQALQFIKRITKFDDKQKQKAEIHAYFGQYDLAEKLYMEMDRKNLAIDLRIRLGDWFRVVQLIKSGGGGDDILLEKAWDAIGDHYCDKREWVQAANYYQLSRNYAKLVDCYYHTEDYDKLEKLISSIQDGNMLLRDIGDKFATVGMCEQAVLAYVKAGDVKSAIDTCVMLNQWGTAVELAETHKFRDIESLLAKYGSHLLEKNKRLDAIELYRKANYCAKSAKLLFQLADEATKSRKEPLLIKKMYVLAALEVERYHQIQKTKKGGREDATAALEGLLAEDAKNSLDPKFLDSAWRGAEAYHFYLLAQRQFYQGDVKAAVKTALHLRDFDDILDPKSIYSLLAFAAFHAKMYGTCSKAFIKLEAMETLSEEEREMYENLALNIFTKFPPVDPKGDHVNCNNCGNFIRDNEFSCQYCNINFPACVVTGRPIVEYQHFMCTTCKHRAHENSITSLQNCPLCHSSTTR